MLSPAQLDHSTTGETDNGRRGGCENPLLQSRNRHRGHVVSATQATGRKRDVVQAGLAPALGGGGQNAIEVSR